MITHQLDPNVIYTLPPFATLCVMAALVAHQDATFALRALEHQRPTPTPARWQEALQVVAEERDETAYCLEGLFQCVWDCEQVPQ